MADVRHHGDAQPHRLFRRDGLRPRIHTQGNAGTTTISYWMYRILLNQEESMFHISNAAGLIMMLLTVPVVFVGRFIMNKWGKEIEY